MIKWEKLKEADGIRMNALVYQLFEVNPDGKELLRLWTRQYLLRAVATPNFTEAMARFHEGQNDIIRKIYEVIDSIKNEVKNGTKQSTISVNTGKL